MYPQQNGFLHRFQNEGSEYRIQFEGNLEHRGLLVQATAWYANCRVNVALMMGTLPHGAGAFKVVALPCTQGRHVTVKLTFVTMVTWLQLTGCLNMLYGIK